MGEHLPAYTHTIALHADRCFLLVLFLDMVLSPLVIESFGLRGIILYLNSSSKLQIKLVLSKKGQNK